MSREDMIQVIESLYPVDSEFPDIADIGGELLKLAVQDTDWRQLPTEILERYKELCLLEHDTSFTTDKLKRTGVI